MAKRRQPELSPLVMTPEQQEIVAQLKQQSLKASAERHELPCPRCEQPLQVSNYSHPILEGVSDVVLWCLCGFIEY
jgi:hypothetical protein